MDSPFFDFSGTGAGTGTFTGAVSEFRDTHQN
jgi:hypothetical protein